MIRARSTNHLLQSERYPVILEEYNQQFRATGGRVNSKEFWEKHIQPYVPNYPISTWYGFLRRFRSDTLGIISQITVVPNGNPLPPPGEIELHKNLVASEIATQSGIKHALNLGAKFYEDLWLKYKKDPNSLNQFEQRVLADALHKAMKSQDSRIHALGKIREDSREQAKFERAFEGAAFGETDGSA